jgi:hypothetical protein
LTVQPAFEQTVPDWVVGGGEMGKLVRSMDWSQTSLGPIDSWPQSLRTTVNICLASDLPICIIWGPGLVQIYNDGYRVICGGKHPHSMGQNFRFCRDSVIRPTKAAGPTSIRKPASRTGSLQTKLGL